MGQEPVLEVKNLTKRFGPANTGFTAVDNISFSLVDGEILGLLGPNGAGKTTTIQMLLGIMIPTQGSIAYFGKQFEKHREEILNQLNFSSGYVRLPWLLTVEETLNVYARLYNVPDKKKRIKKLLEIFEIEEFLKTQFFKLSAGERSRAVLVKAFLNYPRILLLDEPTASLDPDIASKVRGFLKKEREEFNVSMLLTSHNMAEVEEVCDRVMFINHGAIVAKGTTEEIAKDITDCRLQLMIGKDLDKALAFLKRKGISANQDRRYITIEIPERQIALILSQMAKENIEYEEISIEKPNLEDFFLTMTKKGKIQSA